MDIDEIGHEGRLDIHIRVAIHLEIACHGCYSIFEFLLTREVVDSIGSRISRWGSVDESYHWEQYKRLDK